MRKTRVFDRLDELTILHQSARINELEKEIKMLKDCRQQYVDAGMITVEGVEMTPEE